MTQKAKRFLIWAAVVYSTIWPIKNLTVYTHTHKTQSIGTAQRGTAFCVLREEDGMFRIRLGNKYGYIDSNYCLINLPECMGDLCSYDITNSYASVFKIHEYPIPQLADVVVPGYENVMIGNLEDESRQYLVPLLYPVAQKLGVAARAVQEAGYKLRIVDSFRPKKATLYMYDTALEYAENTIVPAELGGTKTFYEYMSDDGRFPMSYFVSKGPSNHNRGFALDLTLENADGEVQMQTAIHDLSWFSEPKQNNATAKKLAQFMKSAGFKTIVSEWWHFNDMDTRDAFNPPALDEGVTPECWMANENGWRYRQADGTYLVNCSETIGGIKYRFDEKGYAIPD